jgi:homoserine kinase type II
MLVKETGGDWRERGGGGCIVDHFAADESKLQEIVDTIERHFGLRVLSADPMERGWLNRKWKLATDDGERFAKQYHPERYRLHEPEKLRTALLRQMELKEAGLPCPKLFGVAGEPILITPSGVRFVVTDFCPGVVVEPGGANGNQMRSLGRVAGMMHGLLNGEVPGSNSPARPHWEPESPERMIEMWRRNWEASEQGKRGPDGFAAALDRQKNLIERLDVGQFAGCAVGWAHWDLWADNVLFAGDEVSAVLDFDRMRVLYPELDVARAVMSFALNAEASVMNKSLVEAFLAGYRERCIYPPGTLARSLKLLWCLESLNWMVHDMDQYSAPPARFARENIWLTMHWDELEEMFRGV